MGYTGLIGEEQPRPKIYGIVHKISNILHIYFHNSTIRYALRFHMKYF